MSENIKDMIEEFMALRENIMDEDKTDGADLIRYGELRRKLFDELGLLTDIRVIVISIPSDTYENNGTVQDILNQMNEELGSIDSRINIIEADDIAMIEVG